ncbi:MAG TPA: hypothetical protein VF590_26275, partial [Isosphaeraceae bacterium]
MTSYNAGYLVGFVIGLVIVISVILAIGAAIFKLACTICGEKDVSIPRALGILLVNWLAQMGVSLVVNFVIVPALGQSPGALAALGLATLVVNLLVAATIVSAMIPTSFPRAIAICLMHLVVIVVFILIFVFVVFAVTGRSFAPGRTAPTLPASAPERPPTGRPTDFLVEALDDFKSLKNAIPADQPLASRAAGDSSTPDQRGPALAPTPTANDDGGGFNGPRFSRPEGARPAAPRTSSPVTGAQPTFTPQVRLWQVQVDLPAEPAAIPAGKPPRIPIPANFFKGHDVVFPALASPFLAVGKNGGDDNVREVWDLREGRRVGRLAGKVDLDEKLIALSPDGKLLAGKVAFKDTVGIVAMGSGRAVGQVDLGGGSPDLVEFLGPDRLLVGGCRAKRIEVWDITAGRKLREIAPPAPVDPQSAALSPGARYLAVTSKDDGVLRVYDLQTGQEAGEETLPKIGPFGAEAQGMAFSPDGAELAAVFEAFGKVRILDWTVADGRLAADYNFENTRGLKREFGYEGPGLQWLPGLQAWLVFGQAVVDRATGQKVHSFPFDRQNYQPSPRLPLDGGRILVVVGDRARLVVGETIPPEVVRALEIARAGGNAADALLPPLTAPDLSKARAVPAGAGSVTWSVAPDPGPAGKAFVSRPIALRSQAGEPRRILVSAADAAVALVSNQAGGPLANQEDQPRWLDRYDLTGGKHLGRLDLPSVCEPVAVSPDGTLALTVDAKARDRLDVWSLTGKTPVAGWRPYETEAGDGRAISWAAFLDAGRVLTLSASGRLILWGVPGGQAVYVAETGAHGTAALSPGRKWLALGAGAGVRLLDPTTGQAQGEAATTAPGDRELRAVAFSADGRALLALVNETLVRWDLATGRAVAEFRSPVGTGTQLEWCGPRHALIDNQKLIDLVGQRH